jgi:predicted SAM-dependent methyltransferase
MTTSKMLNIGCGATYHPDWINLDVSPNDPSVMTVDILNGLPFPSESVAVCYSSHVLEHLEKVSAPNLLSECFRVLENGGVIRLVLPDLEGLVREYLRVLDAVTAGDCVNDLDYDWIMLEMYDQTVRNSPGGEMVRFLTNLEENNRTFVRSRIGDEAESFWLPKKVYFNGYRQKKFLKKIHLGKLFKLFRINLAGCLVYLIAGKDAYRSFRMGVFRDSGEVHQWMYDRYSLKRLLEQAGFVNIKMCEAGESRILGYEKFSLDVLKGSIRKPDSLYIEATKP